MSWHDHHRRQRTVDGVLAEVARTGKPQVPASWAGAVGEDFGGQAEFLAALHYRWLVTLTARLDGDGADPGRAQAALAAERPALFTMLAAHAGHPALARGAELERLRCGIPAGPAWRAGHERDRALAAAS